MIFFRTDKVLRRNDLPLVVRLRDISRTDSDYPLSEQLFRILELAIHLHPLDTTGSLATSLPAIKFEILSRHLEMLNAALLLDGLDEIADDGTRTRVVSELRRFAATFGKARLVLTCRVGEYKYEIEGVQKYEIAPFLMVR